jgi:hypothetical protein
VVVVERQAGLGKSLNDVIESLTPAEPDAPLTRGNDLHDITPQLYRLVLDVQELRDRVDRLEATNGNGAKSAKKSKKKRDGAGGKKPKKH